MIARMSFAVIVAVAVITLSYSLSSDIDMSVYANHFNCKHDTVFQLNPSHDGGHCIAKSNISLYELSPSDPRFSKNDIKLSMIDLIEKRIAYKIHITTNCIIQFQWNDYHENAFPSGMSSACENDSVTEKMLVDNFRELSKEL